MFETCVNHFHFLLIVIILCASPERVKTLYMYAWRLFLLLYTDHSSKE